MRVAAVKPATAGPALATPGDAATAGRPPTRQPIEMPADVEAFFRAQMLGHIVRLDAVMRALATGDVERSDRLAEPEIVPAREPGVDASGRTAAEGEPSDVEHRALPAAVADVAARCRRRRPVPPLPRQLHRALMRRRRRQ